MKITAELEHPASLSPRAFNNAGQALVSERLPTGRAFPFDYQSGVGLVSGGQYWTIDRSWNPMRMNNAGRSLLQFESSETYAVWDHPSAAPRLLRPPVPGKIQGLAWNDFEQTVIIDEAAHRTYLWNTRSGELREQTYHLADAGAINAKGCIAGHLPEGDLVIVCDETLYTVEPKETAARTDRMYLNERGWLLYRQQDHDKIWDGATAHSVQDLIPEGWLKSYPVSAVSDLTNDGWLVVRSRQENYAPYFLMRPEEAVEPLVDIVKPEAGPELTGHGEYLGCEAMTGWVFDASRPDMAPAVELYEGSRLIGAVVARLEIRSDGVYGYHIDLPPAILRDGQPHFFNVRFAGTATAVEQAWGTIQCPPNR